MKTVSLKLLLIISIARRTPAFNELRSSSNDGRKSQHFRNDLSLSMNQHSNHHWDYGGSTNNDEFEHNPNPVFPPFHHNHQEVVFSSPPQGETSAPPPTPGLQPSKSGMYQINSEEEYKALLEQHPDKLIIVKFYASFCRSCKALEPKMRGVMRHEKLAGLPILWAEFQSHRNTKDLFRSLEVITLPTIHFYDGSRGLVENFPCPPTKVPLLKKKLARFINNRVDPVTYKILEPEQGGEGSVEPRVERTIIDNELITGEHIDYLRSDLPFFQDLTNDEFRTLIQKARLFTFNPGDIIMRQGMRASHFYVIKTGTVEMSIKSKFDDPISTPSSYLGLVVNTLSKFDYFGERALTTGEPFAASFRSLDKTRCFAFHVNDIPSSSILSWKRQATHETVELLNQRYVLPEDYDQLRPQFPVTKRDESILDLLVRFKQIRQAANCFEYIMKNDVVNWGNAGQIARRSLLVRKLSYSQRNEFNEVFNIVDCHRRGEISLLQLQNFMESARESKADSKWAEMINIENPSFDGSATFISREEFMGVMAEAEFYNLFRETFRELDYESTGFVRTGDLDQILGGVRDLIGDKKHTSIIDVDDKDMLVDYEQFSKMLLGAAF